ncbi:type I-E CRISPR-associated protein Cas5/CasD [candidate division WOR-3 bacterium]|nr:type I-E CRISPR-associated protein Cas5/CasD [candidate division WOR-3 bacterium]
MGKKYILLWIEAPLQAWGADSKFGRRDTLPFPTKSGVLGLVLCAMGASGPQNDLLAKLCSRELQIISYVRSKPGKNGQARVKVDKEPLLRDFHMVGSGYDDKDIWQTLLIPMKWDAIKKKANKSKNADGTRGGVKMTYRYYLQDACFAVLLELPADMNDSISDALQNPVYDLYFGRKNCVPAEKIFQGSFESIAEAWQKAGILAQNKQLLEDFRVLDGEYDGDIMTLNDVPVQFGEIKKYRDRRVTVVSS